MQEIDLPRERQRCVFEFANYRAASGQGVTCDGIAVPLAPKELSVLEVLLHRAGGLVSKQELLDAVWPNQIIGEESITRCIHVLRRSLPLPQGASIIGTAYGRGYRITVPVVKTCQRARQWTLGRPTSAPAYAAYLEGRQHARHMRLDSYPIAIGYFEEALRHDPEYAAAHAGIAECRIGQIFFRDSAISAQLARNACAQALSIDPNHALAHAALGWLDGVVDRRVEKGLARLTHALQLDPQCAQSYSYRAWLLSGLGRHEAAVADHRQAAALDPYMSFYSISEAHALFFGGKFEEALARMRGFGTSPRMPARYQALAKGFHCMIAGYLGRSRETIAVAQSMAANAQWTSPSLRTYVAYGLAQCGERRESERVLEELSFKYTPIVSLMPAIHVALGDRKRAQHWIDLAADERCPSLLAHLYDPRIQSLGLRPQSFVRS